MTADTKNSASGARIIDDEMFYSSLKPRPDDSHKGSFGKLLCVCGSLGMTGAAILSSRAACLCGTGLVYLAVPRSLAAPLCASVTEPVMLPMSETAEGSLSRDALRDIVRAANSANACIMGCGLKNTRDTAELVSGVLQNVKSPLLLDADGINALCCDINILKRKTQPLILTPHCGEMSRLTGLSIDEIEHDKLAIALRYAAQYDTVMVLKGAVTVIADPGGRTYVNDMGNSGLAKGGSGDLLAGMIGAFLAQGYDPLQAAVNGVYLHSRAGALTAARLGKTSMQPSDVLQDIYRVFSK